MKRLWRLVTQCYEYTLCYCAISKNGQDSQLYVMCFHHVFKNMQDLSLSEKYFHPFTGVVLPN